MQAAVKAERAEATTQNREETTWPPGGPTVPGAADSDVAVPAAKRINGKRKRVVGPESDVRTRRTVKPEHSAKRRPDDKAGHVAGSKPVAGVTPDVIGEAEELTERLGVQPAAVTKPTGAWPAKSEQYAAPVRTRRPASPSPRAAKKPGRRRRRARLAAWAVIVLTVGSLSVAAVRYFTHSSGHTPTAAQLRQAAAARSEAAAARSEAVAWVAQHVSRDAVVACDPVTRAALTAHGFPSRELLLLGPTTPDSFVSAAVVVETPAVQGMFGSSLAGAWAPDVLASFGSGPAAVTVRVIAPHGAGAYQTALDGDQAARRTAGAALLDDSQISIPVPAENQLAAGQVDSRLLLALADLAARQPIRIVQFGNDGPGASDTIPFRFVDLAENVPAAHQAPAAYVKSVRDYLGHASTKYRPASMTNVPLANGQAVLRITVSAPSPLGLFGPNGSS